MFIGTIYNNNTEWKHLYITQRKKLQILEALYLKINKASLIR